MIRWLVAAIGVSVAATHVLAAEPVEIGIGYLGHAGVKASLSLVEQPAANDGVAGARLAIEDNNTTGKFLNQRFTLDEVRLKAGDDVANAARTLAGRNGFIIADLGPDELLKAADTLRDRGTVLFNAGAIDDRLREADCRANVDYATALVKHGGGIYFSKNTKKESRQDIKTMIASLGKSDGSTFKNTDYVIHIKDNTAFVTFDQTVTAVDGAKSFFHEVRYVTVKE